MKKWLILIAVFPLLFAVTGCKRAERPEPVVLIEEEVEEEIEVYIEPLEDEAYKMLLPVVAKRVLVFDVGVIHDDLLAELNRTVTPSGNEERDQEAVKAVVEQHLDEWKRQEIETVLYEYMDQVSRDDVERYDDDIHMDNLVDLVVFYEMKAMGLK